MSITGALRANNVVVAFRFMSVNVDLASQARRPVFSGQYLLSSYLLYIATAITT